MCINTVTKEPLRSGFGSGIRMNGMRKLRSAFLWLSIAVLFGLTARSVGLYAKGPSFEETMDFIILKLSGVSVSSRVQCDKVRECGGSIDTVWQNSVAPSLSSCSIEVIQTINVTKTQNAICVWTGETAAIPVTGIRGGLCHYSRRAAAPSTRAYFQHQCADRQLRNRRRAQPQCEEGYPGQCREAWLPDGRRIQPKAP